MRRRHEAPARARAGARDPPRREGQFSDILMEIVAGGLPNAPTSCQLGGHLMVEPVSLAAAPARLWRAASRHPDGVA